MSNITFTNLPLETDLSDARPNDGYPSLLMAIRKSWEESLNTNDPIFTTDAENLYDAFLNNLPEEARQHYTCRACRDFVNRYGGLVTIDESGNIVPVMWEGPFPEFFAEAQWRMHKIIMGSRVTGPFYTSLDILGIPKTGMWEHMAVPVPNNRKWQNLLKTADQRMAELKQDHATLWHAITKYKIETVETAVNLLTSDSLSRSEKIRSQAQWFLDILKIMSTNIYYRNAIWYKVVKAPAGYCHIAGGVLGSLLDDIQDGMNFEAIKNRFNAKMDPLHYLRPQAAPSTQNVIRAEKIFAELGLENSLKRRYARIEELLQTIWKPRVDVNKPPYGIFGRVKTKDSSKTRPTNNLVAPATTMTWNKFQRTVLPTAKKIEYLVSYGRRPYAAIVTAADTDAPPIIAWDRDDFRNPFSWYLYANGSNYSDWNLQSGWVDVTAITEQPNQWTPNCEHYGKSVFFILKDCRDIRPSGLALFPEILRGDLHEVRATIEAYSKDGEMAGANEATACGIMLTSNNNHVREWGKLRVTTDVGIQEYILDRWD